MGRLRAWLGNGFQSFLGAITFYSCIPVPQYWGLKFERIARWAPIIGVLLGAIVGTVDGGLKGVGMPVGTRSAVVVALGVALTGGLHLDGAIDTADGLAVMDRQRRLAAMQDSVVGAFGAIAAATLLVLKTTALSDIEVHRTWALMAAAGWGRWGQVVAIALYPYLKPTGKGAFHKENIRLPQDVLLGVLVLLGLSGSFLVVFPVEQSWFWATIGGGGAIAFLTGYGFHRQLGGHTGDTYGAVVEWTEAFLLCFLTLF
ncbi:MAG: adenosylcobinamide-GDP ribazoletransferase [Cyanobacteriota bacterium]|nr:adenosylcobinamide-GDP ribazoletransferase [Cyanobacteriota bacterium]